MSAADDTWPPALKEWVASCLGAMTDSNRAEAQMELKKVINDAFMSRTLWTIEWSKVQLQSLQPKPISIPLKRKLGEASHPNASPAKKKEKKNVLAKAAVPTLPTPSIFADADERAALAKRARRFEREHEIERQRSAGLVVPPHVRIASPVPPPPSIGSRMLGLSISKQFSSNRHVAKKNMYGRAYVDDDNGEADPNVHEWDRFTIVGHSQELFKHYLRLTSEPDPATIRPLPVLQKTLSELKSKWRRENNYPWICDQFKSLRQDLTVQRIKNDFTVLVYEIHARMALENGDLVEYNSCISSLRQLYELGIAGKNEEFTAYRILFLVHAKNRGEINRLVGQLTAAQKAAEPIRHALDVQRAVASSNYHALFVLFNKAPNMGAYIMDHFVMRERVNALMCMGKVYTHGIALSFITSELAFDTLEDAHKFLVDHKAASYLDKNVPHSKKVLDCKAAYPALAAEFAAKYRKVGIKGSV